MTATLTKTEDAVEAAPHHELPISSEDKTTILLNVETAVKDLIFCLAKKQEFKGLNIAPEEFAHLPNSLTGVMVFYLVEGLKKDFDIVFSAPPVSLKQRGGGSPYDKKVSGKKRLLTREQKNELLAKTQMFYYEKDIASGTKTIEDAMLALKNAYEQKANFEEMGYMLPPKKTEYPYWVDEAEEK